MESASGPRSIVTGRVVRAYLDHVAGLGLEPEIRARLSPRALELVNNQPLSTAWVDSALTDEISIGLQELRGKDAVRTMGYDITREALAPALRTFIASALALVGATPARFFARVPTFIPLFVRNAELEWAPAGPSSGTLTLRHAVPLHEAAYAIWEGVFLYAFELLGKPGKVSNTRLSDGGRVGVIDLSW